MLRKTIDRAECEVEFDFFLEGSVLRGTVSSGARACRTRLHIDSPEPEEVIERIVGEYLEARPELMAEVRRRFAGARMVQG